ncbi:hypothetical protein, partial [Parvimonas sp. D4]|uniref:hypothetical protein n=1 Tax=Parvimonas sp. D4 TaxID=3110690 RepID=UPI002B499E91
IVTVTEKPFSYIFPTSNFPPREMIWDDAGAEKVQLSRRAMQGGEGGGGGAPGAGGGGRGAGGGGGRRLTAWRPDGKGLSFVQVQQAPLPDDGTAG